MLLELNNVPTIVFAQCSSGCSNEDGSPYCIGHKSYFIGITSNLQNLFLSVQCFKKMLGRRGIIIA